MKLPLLNVATKGSARNLKDDRCLFEVGIHIAENGTNQNVGERRIVQPKYH